MYRLDGISGGRVDPGTNLLVSGPPTSDKRRVGLRILAAGTEVGDGAVIVTTTDGAEVVLDEYADHGDLDGSPVGVVDCVSGEQAGGVEESHVKYASSPVDMTGMGIQLSSFLEEYYVDRDLDRTRVLVDSVSTMLLYEDLETVFRFLHVFTGRIASANALALYVVDSTAHDEQALSTLRQLFDGEITVEEGDDGEEATLRGPA